MTELLDRFHNIYLTGQKDKPNWFGCGQTEGELMIATHGIPRIGSDYNKARDAGVKYIELGFYVKVKVPDKKIHRFLKKIPGITKVGTESFEITGCGLTLDIVKDMVEKKFFSNTPAKKKSLTLHPHQKEFIAKAQAKYLEFLLFAKCRSGKSVMTLSHIIDKGHKVSLVVSRYSSPMQSWRDDIKEFSNFNNLVFIDINEDDYLQQIDYWYKTGKQLILWACVQSSRILNLPIDIDFLVYDEAHVGYNRKQWNRLREVTNCPVLYVTGTAYKLLDDFTDSQKYSYSYFEEQYNKKKGLNNRPSMEVILAKYDSSKYQAIFGSDSDGLKNIFNTDDGNFVEPSLVQEFVTDNFGTQRTLRPKDRLLKDSTHLYLTLPSVAACRAIVKYMKGTRFAPLVVTGETGKDAEDINKHIEENPNGSCIITRTANVLGLTASKIDTIINCAEGSSMEFWTQFAFRGGSGDHNWKVIDFCPQRCLEAIRQAYVAACENNPKIAEYGLSDYVGISEWIKGFTQVSDERIYEILSADVGNAIRLVSGLATRMDFNKLRDLEFNLNLQPVGSNVTKRVQLNDNNANGKSNKKMVSKLTKSEKDDIYQKIDTIQSILERIPLVLYHAINSGEVMNTTDSVINSPHYEPVTLDDERILSKALDYGVIRRDHLSKRISGAYVDIQYSITKDDVRTLDELSKSTKDHKSIPVELFQEMIGV
jgi:hypothetical protein